MTTNDYKCRVQTRGARPSTARTGFTLIEMLVVIGVIGILAAMVVALAPVASRHRVDSRVKGEMQQLVTAIENYKAKKGFYPPSNTNDVTKPPLFFELKGTRKIPNENRYETLDRSASIFDTEIAPAYGVAGFVNSTQGAAGADPDSVPADDFHTGLKLSQVRPLTANSNIVYLGIPVDGPDGKFSRWRYYSGPAPGPLGNKHNKEGFDLWIELKVGSKTNTYGNWKQ